MPPRRQTWAPLCLALTLADVDGVSGFLYQPGSPSGNIVSEGKPGTGEIWDPSVTYWRGKWCAATLPVALLLARPSSCPTL